jgi:hypothetical protein
MPCLCDRGCLNSFVSGALKVLPMLFRSKVGTVFTSSVCTHAVVCLSQQHACLLVQARSVLGQVLGHVQCYCAIWYCGVLTCVMHLSSTVMYPIGLSTIRGALPCSFSGHDTARFSALRPAQTSRDAGAGGVTVMADMQHTGRCILSNCVGCWGGFQQLLICQACMAYRKCCNKQRQH